ncbi:Hypothetical_protein [Hexamita inflata]|uniref:Hypothetical_protein n=1 Tax=Hexamita inflata TaxID=28002 RepID=A0AA86RHY8_9EUKA|nr:Hypothetical protein HINF_LOCUS64512 [Hexamita inflata]
MEQLKLIRISLSVESSLTTVFNYNMTLSNTIEARPGLVTNCNLFHTRFLNILLIQAKVLFKLQSRPLPHQSLSWSRIRWSNIILMYQFSRMIKDSQIIFIDVEVNQGAKQVGEIYLNTSIKQVILYFKTSLTPSLQNLVQIQNSSLLKTERHYLR